MLSYSTFLEYAKVSSVIPPFQIQLASRSSFKYSDVVSAAALEEMGTTVKSILSASDVAIFGLLHIVTTTGLDILREVMQRGSRLGRSALSKLILNWLLCNLLGTLADDKVSPLLWQTTELLLCFLDCLPPRLSRCPRNLIPVFIGIVHRGKASAVIKSAAVVQAPHQVL